MYDLIFLGSVFTHTPPTVTKQLLTQAIDALRENGVLVFTTQGRYSEARFGQSEVTTPYGLTGDQAITIQTSYGQSGYGFVEYETGRNYGLSLIHPAWIDQQFGDLDNVIQLLFQEKGYDNHQDAYGFMKCPLMETRRSGL